MSADTAEQRQDDQQRPDDGSWLDADVDGRPVRFWIVVAVTIAAVTLGFGAWWTWGLGRDMPMAGSDGAMDGQMGDMPATDVQLPPVAGLYDGEQVFFVHPEASDDDVATMLTDMMGGSPVLAVPELADVPLDARDDVYVFTNGIEGPGPFGFQPDVFPSAPGDDAYRPLRTVVLVSWVEGVSPRTLGSTDEITAAVDDGEIVLEATDVVVNMPFLVWPGGRR